MLFNPNETLSRSSRFQARTSLSKAGNDTARKKATQMKMLTVLLVASIGILATSAFAQLTGQAGAVPLVTVDEFGNGTYNGTPLQSAMRTDPFSGITTLAYFLPFSPAFGDVLLLEPFPPAINTNTISDILRFENGGTNQGFLYFFSDASTNDPADAPADVQQLPQILTQFPIVTLGEVGPEGNNGATYVAAAGGPGSNLLTGGQVQYNIISDGIIPEPGSILLGTFGGALLLLSNRRRRHKTA